MQIQIEPGPIQTAYAAVAALACLVVAYKSFDHVRDILRQRRENRDAPPGADANRDR